MPLDRTIRPSWAGMRPAFTVVELLVAITVLTVGVLALAATAGLVASHVGDGARLTHAAHAARSALDSLGTRPCSALVSGVARAGGREVRWQVERDSLAAHIGLTTRADLRRTSQEHRYRAVVPCVTE